jgi:hypothetical protein
MELFLWLDKCPTPLSLSFLASQGTKANQGFDSFIKIVKSTKLLQR